MWILSDRLLKAMGWQEYPENDDNFQPLTEDELKEFQAKTEQVWDLDGIFSVNFILSLFFA